MIDSELRRSVKTMAEKLTTTHFRAALRAGNDKYMKFKIV